MSYSVKKYNKNKFNYDRSSIDTSLYDNGYESMTSLYNRAGGDIFAIQGVFINNSPNNIYGDAPVIIFEDHYLNCPKHMLNTFTEMLEDNDFIQAVNNGDVGFHLYKYYSQKHSKECYGIEFDDI